MNFVLDISGRDVDLFHRIVQFCGSFFHAFSRVLIYLFLYRGQIHRYVAAIGKTYNLNHMD